jgi:hypothetical protein
MHEDWIHQLEAWHDFFIVIGTAGLTLTGLLFVVVSLAPRVIAHRPASGVKAFLSPNVVYFTTALVVSAMLLVPSLPPGVIGTLLCTGAVGSLVFLASTKAHEIWRDNKLPFLDWIWFIGLPVTAYGLLLLSGIGFLSQATLSMHGLAVALILLLVVGIRNAWDLVIWISQREHE